MTAESASRGSRLGTAFRQEDRVMPLELFFDLVFVLAITQCTTLMSQKTTWGGVGEGILVLALLWWSWVGYAWLTSVLDPEEGAIRIVLFCAMASFLIAAICVPESFGGLATEFALAYAAVRVAHIALFLLASRDDPAFRRSVLGLAVGTALGVALLIGGRSSTRAVRPHSGRWRWSSTWASPTCSAPRDGGWCPDTSPSDTA